MEVRDNLTSKVEAEEIVYSIWKHIAVHKRTGKQVTQFVEYIGGWEIPNPINALNSDSDTRCPFAVLKDHSTSL